MQATVNGLNLRKTAKEIAAFVGGKLTGDGSLVIDGVSGLAEAGPTDLSFLGNPKYAAQAVASKAGCILVPDAAQAAAGTFGEGRNLIFVPDPQFAFAQVLSLIDSLRPRPAAGIDPKASVHPQAKIGQNVSVGPFTVVEKDAVIGDDSIISAQVYIGENTRLGSGCKIYAQVVIRENCVIGDRVILQPGCVIGGDGYGFSPDKKTGRFLKIPQLGNVVLGDDVEVQAGSVIDRGTVGSTVIGAGTKIDNLVQIAHNVKVGRNCLLVSQVGVAGSTELGDNVVLGGQVGVVGHIKVGAGAQVGAQSGLMSDVEPGKIMFGSPARPHREAFKLQALYGRLPELFDAVKKIQKKLGPEA
jgi:UDP-3-O-[3-hydroxymyristoyl] glucosamine N-acyltransferase